MREAKILTVYKAPAAAAPCAVATSPSGWHSRWYAVGAIPIGVLSCAPSSVVRVSHSETSTSTRGRSEVVANARRLAASVCSSSAPPSMKSQTSAGTRSRATVR